MSNQYANGNYDTDETRRKKAECARRRTGKAQRERDRIAANIERIGLANDAAAATQRRDIVYYICKIYSAGYLKCHKVG